MGYLVELQCYFMALEILDDISLEQKSSQGRQCYIGNAEKEGKKP